MNKVFFPVYVFESYQKDLPCYIYFINLNYPKSNIIIYKDVLSNNIYLALNNYKKYKLFENIFSEYNKIKVVVQNCLVLPYQKYILKDAKVII